MKGELGGVVLDADFFELRGGQRGAALAGGVGPGEVQERVLQGEEGGAQALGDDLVRGGVRGAAGPEERLTFAKNRRFVRQRLIKVRQRAGEIPHLEARAPGQEAVGGDLRVEARGLFQERGDLARVAAGALERGGLNQRRVGARGVSVAKARARVRGERVVLKVLDDKARGL
jgi:hypothetical protein